MPILNMVYYAAEWGGGWQPWADTLLYYDFEHTSWTTETDVVGNYNWTYNSTPTIWTLSSGKKYFDTEWNKYCYTNSVISNLNYNNCTVNVWLYIQNFNSKSRFGQTRWNTPNGQWTIFLEDNSSWFQCCLWPTSNWIWWLSKTYLTGWTNLVLTNDWTTFKVYSNGTQIGTKSSASWSWSRKLYIWVATAYWWELAAIWDTRFGSMIIENKVWTQQDITDYFNSTKSNYWIS